MHLGDAMPARAARPCSFPHCPDFAVQGGRCEEHARKRERARREHRGPRVYDRRVWRDQIRPAQLRREPLCRFCLEDGRTEAAAEVDHIDGDPWNNREDNLRSLCKPCHTGRTSRDQVHGATP